MFLLAALIQTQNSVDSQGAKALLRQYEVTGRKGP